MAKADQRVKAELAAKKRLALAEAKTPEERAAVEARFSEIDRDNALLDATRDERAAQEFAAGLSAEARQAEAALREAEERAEQSAANAAAFKPEVRFGRRGERREVFTDPAAINARKIAQADAAAVQLAREAYQSAADQAAAGMNSAYDTQRDVMDRRNLISIESRAAAAEARNAAPASSGPSPAAPAADPARIAQLRRTAEDAQARGDFATQDQAVAELRALRTGNAKLINEVVQTARSMATALETAARETEKQRRRQDSAKESRTGQ
jgi:hypothetical protein